MSDTQPDFMTGTPGTQSPERGSGEFTAALLQATLNAKKCAAIVALAWDGPQWAAFSVSLGLGEDPERVERLSGALALAAGAEWCRVSRRAGGLVIEIPKPAGERKALSAERLNTLKPPNPLAVAVGVSTGGKAVWLDLADERHCHVVIGGTTGSGKSTLTHWLLYRLFLQNHVGRLRVLLLDPKRRELERFAHIPHLLHPIVSSPTDCARVLTWAVSELDARMERGRTLPEIVIVIEEIKDLATTGGILPAVERLAQVGRGVGLHLVTTTQQPGSKSLGDALVNFPARILGRVASATLTYGAAGRARSGADTLLGRGDFLLMAAGEQVRFQAPLMGPTLWGALPNGTPGSLKEKLPTVAGLADLQRDARGGRGRKELDERTYERMADRVLEGATADELKAEFGIGWERARRIVNGMKGEA